MKKILEDFKFYLFILIFSMLYVILLNKKFSICSGISIEIMITVCVYASSVVIIYRSDCKGIDNLYRYLSIGFAGSAAISASYFFITTSRICDNKSYSVMTLFLVNSLFQMAVLIFSFNNHKKSIPNNKITCITMTALFLTIYSLEYVRVPILKEICLSNMMVTKIIAQLLLCGVYSYIFSLIHKNKEYIERDILRNFYYYSCLKLLSDLLIIAMYGHLKAALLISIFIFGMLADYFILKIMVLEVIRLPQMTLYRSLDNKTKKLEDTLNMLSEAKNMIEEEAQKSLLVIEELPCGVLMFKDGKIEYANNEIVNMFKLKNYRQIVGKTMFDFIDNKDYERLNKRMQIIEKRGMANPEEYEYHLNDVDIYGEITCMKLNMHNVTKVICLLRNITERKKLEEVRKLLDKKKREEEIKNELLTNISHEFKTPVNVIYSAIQIQKLKQQVGEFGEILKYNDVIKQNCNRLIRLINNFIDTTRLTTAGIKVNLKTINIVDFVENITMSVAAFAESRGIKITFDTCEEEIFTQIDAGLLDRAVLNIISNSIKYNKENGSINVYIEKSDNDVDIIVEDTGIGIPENKKKTVFKRFERGDKSLSRTREGSGLGLNIVKQIVKLHKGTIEMESKENVGTKVTIKIPIIKEKINDKEAFSICDYDYMKYNAELEMSDIYS